MSRRSVLLAALAAGVPACSASDPPAPAELVLATGPDGAVFREVGAALARALGDQLPDTRVVALQTAASVENVRLLQQGSVHLGLSSLDPTFDALLSADDPDGISAVGRLYDSFLQVVVPAGSGITRLADLAGLRVSFGPRESGTEFTATRLLDLLGIRVDARRMAHAEAARQLADGSIDVLLALTGIPTPAIGGLPEAFPIRLLDLPDEAVRLAEAHPGPYVPVTIPATTYRGLGPCRTFAVPNLLLARTALDPSVVEVVTRTVFTESARIAAGHPEAGRINVRTGIATGQVPLHRGAERWFRSVKR
ncbi:TRAP transporter solute receptor, TAXI family [Saccharothrix espanaensis DSM 44229]|uniref:TRAP transporter solute receptor, TAXI family n=1 Tax=Saccharothrix espanaensis (strain ATCC 51144 / DSM 44229 / JCM 9112 / NBRC 15066 / NRRL 15764) TaxID=1179773 RepID=K0K6X0_SACES|nr:TRAP transporter solute receptor, TAXI family [Saccharothrix espanaensis DSM 44229]